MKTILFTPKTKTQSFYLSKKCIENRISFDFMNENEFYIPIFDDEHFIALKLILGEEIINTKNIC